MAEFFEQLAEEDALQDEQYRKISKKYESDAYDRISSVESNNLLFVLLNLPLDHPQSEGRSLFHCALKQRRITFLANCRISKVITYQYQHRSVGPKDSIHSAQDQTYWNMCKSVMLRPFEFYLSQQGYNWVTVTLYVLYLTFIMFYVFYRPINGTVKHFEDKVSEIPFNLTLEITLWILNAGYIYYEIQECVEKGWREYLNPGVQGHVDYLDVTISLAWIFLFGVRLFFLIDNVEFVEDEEATQWQQVYLFVFAVQIVLLSFRALMLFADTKYLGTLIRIIGLMMFEILKFLSIFLIIMFFFF